MIDLLAISGSLRRASINSALVRAIQLAAPIGVRVRIFSRLGEMPLFNPDDEEKAARPVRDFRAALNASDGVIIASPEYAHGITGAMKNALDWVVGSGEFVGMPVALLNAAPRSSAAYTALGEVLRTIDARVVPEASLEIPLLGKNLADVEILADPLLGALVVRVIDALAKTVAADRAARSVARF